jgi:predicted ArsR family transcriptional regulator
MKLLSESQSRILSALKRKGTVSVNLLTRELGLTKTAVRRHLLTMEKRGLIERRLLPGRRGRPSLAFHLTTAAHRLFPSKEAELLDRLLRSLMDSGHEDWVNRFFEDYWHERYEKIRRRLLHIGKDDLKTRMKVLTEELENEGFMPRASFAKRGSQMTLRECHCPIEAASRMTKFPCRLEQRLISRVLNAPIQNAAIKTDSGDACEFTLPTQRR